MKHKLLGIPKLRRKVNIVIVRILEAFYLIPLHIHLFRTVISDLFGCGKLIDQLAVLKDRLLKLYGIEVCKRLGFPCIVGIKYG